MGGYGSYPPPDYPPANAFYAFRCPSRGMDEGQHEWRGPLLEEAGDLANGHVMVIIIMVMGIVLVLVLVLVIVILVIEQK